MISCTKASFPDSDREIKENKNSTKRRPVETGVGWGGAGGKLQPPTPQVFLLNSIFHD